ncbi:MAG: sugar phosphate isomerase/epimerase [Lentisphaeria bacterium]|nr:sugar phosphate isomerase/epimerase [Lentisphaeria bacterium]
MNIPITYHYPLWDYNEKSRPLIMQEFAANGAKHLIVGEGLFRVIMQDSTLAKKLMQEMAQAGLSFVDGHAPFGKFLDMSCPDESLRRTMINRHKLALNIAASLGIKTLTIHCGVDFHTPDVPFEVHIARIKEALAELLVEAEKCGVIIAIENGWYPLGQSVVLLDIKKDFPTDYLGFCYDSGHANLLDRNHVPPENRTEKDWLSVTKKNEVKWENDGLEKMLPHVVSCHLHDNDGSCDQHKRIGSGNIDWRHIKKLLMQAPRLQCIQSEVQIYMANASIRDLVADMNYFCKL